MFSASGSALKWLQSYLTNRNQIVKVGKSSSSITSCSCGVPQGSILGPLLFTVYTSPIANIASLHGLPQQQYADDTQLFISLTSSDQYMSVARLERCLSRLHEWFCMNGLAWNPDKSDNTQLYISISKKTKCSHQ